MFIVINLIKFIGVKIIVDLPFLKILEHVSQSGRKKCQWGFEQLIVIYHICLHSLKIDPLLSDYFSVYNYKALSLQEEVKCPWNHAVYRLASTFGLVSSLKMKYDLIKTHNVLCIIQLFNFTNTISNELHKCFIPIICVFHLQC